MNKLITKLTLTLASMVVVNELEQRTERYEKSAEGLSEVTKYIGTKGDLSDEVIEENKSKHKEIAKTGMCILVGGAVGLLVNMIVDNME